VSAELVARALVSSKRHIKSRQCGSKRQFAGLSEARRMVAFQRLRSGERWSAYRCRWCGFCHIGHARA